MGTSGRGAHVWPPFVVFSTVPLAPTAYPVVRDGKWTRFRSYLVPAVEKDQLPPLENPPVVDKNTTPPSPPTQTCWALVADTACSVLTNSGRVTRVQVAPPF